MRIIKFNGDFADLEELNKIYHLKDDNYIIFMTCEYSTGWNIEYINLSFTSFKEAVNYYNDNIFMIFFAKMRVYRVKEWENKLRQKKQKLLEKISKSEIALAEVNKQLKEIETSGLPNCC